VTANKRLSEEQAAALEAGHEPTTILSGGRGVPTVVVRDHDGWAAQVAAENRAAVDEQIRAAVAEIERGDTERRYARPVPVAELAESARANAALHAEARDAPDRVMRELAQTEALLAGWAATMPPPPDAAGAAWQQENEYSHGLAEWMAAHR
jgi:hypothetical protein